jgi:hypothetical protein
MLNPILTGSAAKAVEATSTPAVNAAPRRRTTPLNTLFLTLMASSQ